MAKLIKCRACGSEELIEKGDYFQCAYCQHKIAKPNANEELLNRANHLRMISMDFEAAIGIYDDILKQSPDEAEAYWGRLLCRYGIQYSEDAPGRFIPTCRRTNEVSIFDDVDYGSALRYANEEMAEYYRREAEFINEIQKRIMRIVHSEQPYDVFISFKAHDEYGYPTEDQRIAEDIYYELKDKKHLRVFYSEITLKDKLGEDFEPYIFAALSSAPVMVLVGTKPEYINAAWVKNEWSRFKAMANSAHKNGTVKKLIPVLKGMKPEQLPSELSGQQAVDLTNIGADLKLYRGIKEICDDLKEEKRREQEKRRIEKDRRYTDAASHRKHLHEQALAQAAGSASNLSELGMQCLKEFDSQRADQYFQRALEHDRKCALAHWGKLLVSKQMYSDIELSRAPIDLLGDSQYKQAVSYANAEEAKRFMAVADQCQKNFLYHEEVESLKRNHARNFEEKRAPFDEKADKLYDAYFAAQKEHKQLKTKHADAANASFRLPRFLWVLLVEVVLFLLVTITFLIAIAAPNSVSSTSAILLILLPAILLPIIFIYAFILRRISLGWKIGLGFVVLPVCFVMTGQWIIDYSEYLQKNGGLFPLGIGFGLLAVGVAVIVFRLIKKRSNSTMIHSIKKEIEECEQTVAALKKQIEDRSVEQMQELNRRYREKYGDEIASYASDRIIVTQVLLEKSKSISLGGK